MAFQRHFIFDTVEEPGSGHSLFKYHRKCETDLDNFHFVGLMVLKLLFFSVSTYGGCSGIEGTDFGHFSLRRVCWS